MAYITPAPLSLAVDLVAPRSVYLLPATTNINFLLGGKVRPPAPPSLISRGANSWKAATASSQALLLKSSVSALHDRNLNSRWQSGEQVDAIKAAGWGETEKSDRHLVAAYTSATPVSNKSSVVAWSVNKLADAINKICRWGRRPTRDDLPSKHNWQTTKTADHRKTERLLNVDLSTRPWELRWDGKPRPMRLQSATQLVFSLPENYITPEPLSLLVSLADIQPLHNIASRDATSVERTGINNVADQTDAARWGRGSWYDRSNHLPWEDDSGGEIGDRDPPIEPIKAPYLIMNNIEFYAIVGDEQIAIEPCDLGLKIDLDSFAWELTGTLKGITAKNYIIPDADGPKALAITINGWPWVFAVKSYKRNSKLVGESYAFTAVSRSQFLSGDWSDNVSYNVTSEINAWQLAESLLDPLGFTLDRTNVTEWVRTPDWALQAGSVSWANVKPLDIITQLATAAGATVQPHRTDDTIIIAPRYRISPWEWATAQDSAFSHLIPEAMIVDGSENGEFSNTTQLERVLVAGTTHGAVTEVVKRNTAGIVSAADISDVLNQDTVVNAERGRNVLCDSGSIEQLSIQLPLLPPNQAPGLLEPGQLVKILRENGAPTIGMVLSNSIKPDSVSSVWQSAVLEVHHYGIN